MKINQLKAGVILSYATQAVHILSGLIYTPIMLRLLGQSEYGLYQLVSSIVSYLSLLSLGFGSGYMRFYSRYKANDDSTGIAKLNGMFMIIFFIIALVCLLCGGIMILKADLIFGTGLTTGELYRARILMTMLVFSMAITFVNSIFKSYVTAHEKFFFQRFIEFLKMLFNPFITLPLLIMGYGSIGMVVVSTVLTIFVFVMDAGYCFKKLQIKFSFKNFDFKLLKEMWVFTSFIFINLIVDQINWNVDKFLLGRMVGTVAVAVYGVAAQLNSMYMTLSTSISSVFTPRVNRIIAEKHGDEALTKLFAKVGRVQFIVLGLIISIYILFGEEFIGIWAGNGYNESYQIGILLMLPAIIPLIQNLGIEIQQAKNMHKTRSVVYLLVSLSNIFISIPCIKIWGASGAALGTALSLIVGNGLFMNIYYHKRLGLNIIYFWKEIIKFIPSLVVSVVVGILLRKFSPTGNVIYLCTAIAVYCLMYVASMWLFGMNESEKTLIKGPLKKIGGILCKKS